MKIRNIESVFWGIIGTIGALFIARTFLEAVSRLAPAPLGGRTGFAERVESLTGLQ